MKADDRHPDRPTHPDFARLSEIVIAMDTRAEQPGFSVKIDMTERLADSDSVEYMARKRVESFVADLYRAGLRGGMIMEPLAMATWVDGFMAGASFAESKAQS